MKSKEAGRDLGEESVREWIDKYAKSFREEWEENYGPVCPSGDLNGCSS